MTNANQTKGWHHQPSFVWPILIISAGVILLLNNLGLLPTNSWILLARLWPLALVLLGIDLIIGHRSLIGAIISGVITLLVIASVIALLVMGSAVPWLNSITGQAKITTESVQAPLGEVNQAWVEIYWNPGKGSLKALPADSQDLISGNLETRGKVTFNVNTQGEKSKITVGSQVGEGQLFLFSQGATNWNIGLHPNVLYDLKMVSTSGDHVFDLRDLTLRNIKIVSGSGNLDFSLPKGNIKGDFSIGSGVLSITYPADVALQIEVEVGSGNINLGKELVLVEGNKKNGVWETPNYGQATQQIILSVKLGSGNFTLLPE